VKYKIVGLLSLSFGLIQAAFPVVVYFAVIPRLYKMYAEINAIPPRYDLINAGMLFLLIYGLLNVLVGLMLMLGKGNLEKLFKIGVILFFANFIFGGLVSGLLIIGIITPIYSIGSNI
jgi:hypothetical protein